MKAERFTIFTDFIRLDNLLKAAGEVGTGGQAKLVIQDGEVLVNGSVCIERGKKLREGDSVSFEGTTYTVVKE